MAMTPEQVAARQAVIQKNKESIGLRSTGINTSVPRTDVRSLYSSEPAAPGTQLPGQPPAPLAPKSTINDAVAKVTPFDIASASYNEDPALSAYGAFQKDQAYNADGTIKNISEEDVYNQTRSQFQAQIDAVNAVYKQKLAEAGRIGEGRLGSGRAIQARSGLLGSDFGAAQTDNINSYNTEIDNGIRAEQAAATQAIESQIRNDAAVSLAAKTKARNDGAEAYISYIQGRAADQKQKAQSLITALFNKGITYDKIPVEDIAKLATSYGLSKDAIENMFYGLDEEKKAKEAAAAQALLGDAKTQSEIDKNNADAYGSITKADSDARLTQAQARMKELEADNYNQPPTPGTKDYAEYQKLLAETDKINTDRKNSGQYNLGEGETRYDADGNVIAKGAPKPGGKIVKVNGVDYTVGADGLLQNPVVPEATKQANDIKQSALKSAKELLTKFNAGNGTSAVGASRLLGLQYLPGTAPKDFQVQFDNLKSLLSLDQVKLLKGQGAVSDAERRLLDQASGKINLSQSEGEFKQALSDIIKALSGPSSQPAQGGYTINGLTVETPDGGTLTMPDQETLDRYKIDHGISFKSEGSGSNAQAAIGNAQPSYIALASAERFPVGSTGGQCTTFLHKIASFPPIGDGKLEKYASVDKYGMRKADWDPQVGDIVITGDNPTYGHTFQINAFLGGTKAQVTESNWHGNEKVTYNRVVDLAGSNIYGAIRPGLKTQEA